MDRKQLQAWVEEGISLRQIAKAAGCSQGSVRHWLKKYSLQTRRGPRGKHPKDMVTPRSCPCGETDPLKFYGHKKSTCARCQNQYNLKRGRQMRVQVIQHLGGACLRCGFDAFASALDVHHPDPSIKDPGFQAMRYWKWERVAKEIKSCVLLCKNCHAGVHAGDLNWV